MNQPDGATLIARERMRQIQEEGWTVEHDDEHENWDMARAAIAYTANACDARDPHERAAPGIWWPWGQEWFKPADPIRDLTRAGALIAAEIDRLQRRPNVNLASPIQEYFGRLQAADGAGSS